MKQARMNRIRAAVLAGVMVFFGAVCGRSADSVVRPLVGPEVLKAGKLEVVWKSDVPMRDGEKLERLFLLGNNLYAMSDRNYIVCLNREKGHVVFSKQFTEPGFPILGPDLYNGKLFSIVSNNLVELDTESGKEKGVMRLGHGVACPAARNSEFYYIAGVDKRLRVLRAKDKVKLFEVSAENESAISTIIANEKVAIFGTEAGNVICIAADAARKIWEFKADGGIIRPMIWDGNSIYFASKDTCVYKIGAEKGNLIWKHQAGGILDGAPRVTEEFLYQSVVNKGLSAIDKNSGTVLWQIRAGTDLLAEWENRTYAVTKTGMLVMMDNKKGKRLNSACLPGVKKYAPNMDGSKIYLGDEKGKIECLKPVK